MTDDMQALKSRLKAMWMAGDYGHFGPTNRAFAALDAAAQAALHADLVALWSEANTAKDGTTRVDAEYLAVAAVR